MQCLFQGDDDDEETAENFQKVRLSGSEGYLICRRLNQKNLRREPIPIRDFFIFDYATHTVGQYIKEELTGPEVLIAERSHLSTVGNVYFDQSRRSHFLGSL